MMHTEAKVLHKGIDHLLAGGTVEEYLGQAEVSRLPASSREELLSLLGLATVLLQLRQVPIPAPQAKAANRARFLGEAVRLKEERRVQPLWLRLRLPERIGRGLLGAALAVILVLAIGSGVANAAANSLPGSSLYPLKLVIEDARLVFAFSHPTRTQLYLHFASERTKEMAHLAAAGRPVHESIVMRMAEEWQGAVHAAAASGMPQAHELLQKVIETSDKQKEVLRQASMQAAPEGQVLLEQAIAVTEQASRQAQAALQSLVAPEVVPTLTVTGIDATCTPTAMATPTTVSGGGVPAVAATSAPVGGGGAPASTATPAPVSGGGAPTVTATPTAVNAGLPPTLAATPTEVSTRFTPAPTATPSAEPGATLTPTPSISLRIALRDVPDPVPASHRIHYDVYVINDSDVPMTNVVVVVSWSQRDCIYLLPDNAAEKTWTVGTLEAHSTHHIYFAVSTFVICAGNTVTMEAVVTCDQGTARATETTSIGPPPTPTPTLTPTPQFIFRVTNTDWPDPVPAGYNVHYDICVVNDGDVPLTNVVLVDRWSPRDCVYLAPDNPEQVTWNIGTVQAHSRYCVHLVLSTFSICAGNNVTNEAIMICDQDTARAEQTTSIGPPPAAIPRPTLSLIFTPTALPEGTPTATSTLPPLETVTLTPPPLETMTPTPPPLENMTPTPTLIPRYVGHLRRQDMAGE
nr:hypothetical protein [Chloroflexota bacterium]